jgi:hypothetical protein
MEERGKMKAEGMGLKLQKVQLLLWKQVHAGTRASEELLIPQQYCVIHVHFVT